MQKQKNKETGITLIALVVSIIVLIILAGVSIAMLVGENGIITQAQRAKENTELAEAQEKEDMEKLEDEMNAAITGIKVEQVTDENPGILEGTGTETDPYTINSIEDLVVFANNVTSGTTYEGQTVKLGLNLDFNSNKSYANPLRTDYGKYGYNGTLKQALTSGTGFQPIGELSQTGTNYFYGTFDGNNKAICSLYINIDSDKDLNVGFFSKCYGVVKNLGLVNSDVTVVTKNGVPTNVGILSGTR